jgi:hypothetical protein
MGPFPTDLRLLALLLSLTLGVPAAFAGEYSLQGAVNAAGKIMPADAPKQFALFNVPDKKAKPQQMLDFLRAGKGSKKYFATAAPKNEYLRDLLTGAAKLAKKEKFEGFTLVIVGDRIDPKMFDAVLKELGITAQFGAFE